MRAAATEFDEQLRVGRSDREVTVLQRLLQRLAGNVTPSPEPEQVPAGP